MRESRPQPLRPRSERALNAILSSTYQLLQEEGLSSVTVEAVAQRAGVGKPTIYRYWNNAQELAMAAIMANPLPVAAAQTDQPALQRLQDQLAEVIVRFATHTGRQSALLMAGADPDSELSKAFRNQVILTSRECGRALLAEAVDNGELYSELPVETVLDMIYGPLFYRLLVGHARMDRALADEIMSVVRCAYGVPHSLLKKN